MNYLMAYNKAQYKVGQAQNEPSAGNVRGAESALEAAAGAAEKAGNVAEQVSGNIGRRAALLAQAATPEVQRQITPNQPSLTGNERRNLLKNLTNENTANNTKVANLVRTILNKNPNAKWANVNANGLTNGQRKVLNALKQAQAPLAPRAAPPPPPPPMPSKGNLAAAAAKAAAQRQARRVAGQPAKVTPPGNIPAPAPTHREALLASIASRLFFTGNKTTNGRNVYAASANSKNYYAKKNNGTNNYYRVKKNGNAYNFNTENNKAYSYVKGQGFKEKN